jgi:hypothetical protein
MEDLFPRVIIKKVALGTEMVRHDPTTARASLANIADVMAKLTEHLFNRVSVKSVSIRISL